MVQIPILANKYLKIIVMDTLKHVQKKMNLMKERISHVNRNDLIRFTHTFSPPISGERRYFKKRLSKTFKRNMKKFRICINGVTKWVRYQSGRGNI